MTLDLWIIIPLIGGIVLGYFLRQTKAKLDKSSLELKTQQVLLDAKTKAEERLEEAKKKAEEIVEEARKEEKELKLGFQKLETKLAEKEILIENQKQKIEDEKKRIEGQIETIEAKKAELEKSEELKRKELEKLSGLSAEEAKKALFIEAEKKYQTDLLSHLQKLEMNGEEQLKNKSREIILSIIQRLATSTASEITTSTVSIPSEDLKGRIICKEGRNIRALERAAGVELIVDDTPGVIIISSFDPLRRHIAKIALENLILDGRIQPVRIEEAVSKAQLEIEKLVKEAGEQAAYEVGVMNLEPKLLNILGRLKFRTSYGQNVLQHSIEAAHLAGMLASELGADVNVSKTAALLHDIGKAMDHEIQGSHVEIGKRILEKFGVDKKIILAAIAHHGDYPYETLESIVVQTAEAISASRPGARRDTLENYLRRLEDLEKIALNFEGVDKAYALQAGREIRIFINPEKISDYQAKILCRQIADQIEKDLKYPGEIKVHLIRENRIVEFAR